MKGKTAVFLLATLALAGAGFAAGPDRGVIGLGILLGSPSGVSAKFWLSPSGAIDATLGWDLVDSRLAFQSDYLQHFPVDVSQGFLAPFVGIGAHFAVKPVTDISAEQNYEPYLGARIPLGIEYIYRPVSFFAEVSPRLFFIPELIFDFGGGVGFRFYF